MIDIDLADPQIPAGPPPRHLLGLAALALIVLPLAVCAGLQHATSLLQAAAVAAERHIETLEARAARVREGQRRAAEQRAGEAALLALRTHARAMMALTPALTAQLQPGMQVSALALDRSGGRIAGTARSSAAVSRWLAASARTTAALVWGAPEIRHAPGDAGGVEFELAVRRATPGDDAAPRP